ncbi:hypothetical protein GCM10007111_06790 [Virgibacillus kapii]|uniref:Uncharacterized protein n=1 Tax=Virgibacillus kapii TaxID=1638645 RepID=A0ABQ2D609_9BACI|nr:hypothetical protein GCM10007111_06790 [Virgibacillus kapii]
MYPMFLLKRKLKLKTTKRKAAKLKIQKPKAINNYYLTIRELELPGFFIYIDCSNIRFPLVTLV